MSRRFVPLFAALVLILAACGPNADEPADDTPGSDPSTPATSESAEGSVAPSASGGETGGIDASGDLFVYGFSYDSTDDVVARSRVDYTAEQHPDLSPTFSESGFEATGFLTALQSDDPPDVVRISRNDIGTYIASGRLQPLDDCIAQLGVDTSIYREAAMQQLTSDGTLYGLPDFFDTAVWMAATAELEEDGVSGIDWSDWEAIAAANEQLLTGQGSDLEEIGIDPKVAGDYSFFSLWVYANGGQLLSEDGLESLLDTPEVLEALEFTKGLIEAHGTTSEFLDFRNSVELNGDFFGAPNQFDLGTEAAFPMQQWYLNVAAENSPDTELTVSPFLTRDGEPITFQDGQGWAIVEGSDNPEGACAFITSMVATDAWVAAAETRQAQREEEELPFTGVYSGNSEADEIIFGEMVDLTDFPTFDAAVQAVLEAQENAYAIPSSPASEEFRQIVVDAIDQALTGAATPEEALQAADQEAQDAIDSAAP
ncbi:MAG: extracellular solute-binding protein [Chloroflexota bacterium]|nr:extracellular solute-binding protein [Chloroflexota bacterium]